MTHHSHGIQLERPRGKASTLLTNSSRRFLNTIMDLGSLSKLIPCWCCVQRRKCFAWQGNAPLSMPSPQAFFDGFCPFPHLLFLPPPSLSNLLLLLPNLAC